MNYISKNHWKGLIQYHIIFVCKYRRKIFHNELFREYMKNTFYEISEKYDFKIQVQEIDPSKPDHWHGLICCGPEISPAQIVRVLKQQSTINAWKTFNTYLRQFYWYKNYLWTRGYFCVTVGNASIETIQNYIENQG